MRADLSKAFLTGDSISIGYTMPVMELLRDVIHFNWGLHDLCYRHPEATVNGNRDEVRDTISMPLEDDRANREELASTTDWRNDESRDYLSFAGSSDGDRRALCSGRN